MIELPRILCPVDFSEFSQRALDSAFAVAQCYESTVTALHVVTPMPIATPGAYYFGSEMSQPLVLPQTDRAVVMARVEQFVQAERPPGIPVNILVEESPHIHREILVQAARLKAGLVVMGTHGRSGFERLFLGSTADKVLRTADCPVMTVPRRAPDVMPVGPVPFARILCAVDFSPESKVALTYAVSLATESKAQLFVFHVIEVFPHFHELTPPMALDVDAWMDDARRRLREVIPQASRSQCTIREVVTSGKPYREILSAATNDNSDLIVMGVRGRGATDRLFFGSTASHVVREAHCPVLTLRS
jgi:nucleotide-binding universal stress UspA family protein